MIGIIVASIYTGGAAAGLLGFTAGTTGFAIASGVAAAATSIIGPLGINRLIPPARLCHRQLTDGGPRA